MRQDTLIHDESGDRKYFTQVPNMIVNHSTAYEQSLYLIMKRFAGEKGICFRSLNEIAKNMGIHKRTVAKTAQKLIKRKWIRELDKKKVKGGYVRQFVVIDLWSLNMKMYEGGAHVPTSEVVPTCPEVVPTVPQGGAHVPLKKNPEEDLEENLLAADAAKKDDMRTYNENEPQDDVPTIQEGEEVPTPKSQVRQRLIKHKGYDPALTNELLQWAVDHTGKRYAHPLKQKAHIAAMLGAGRTQTEITEKWLELEQDEYWREKGIDFSIVASQIDKQKKKMKQNVRFS